MKTSLFDFELPQSLIADHPVSPRDAARMLVVDAVLRDKNIRDLPSFLKPGDVMVFNDTRVIPARLLGKRRDAKVEILLHKPYAEALGRWQCFAKPAKRLSPRDVIEFGEDFSAIVVDKLSGGEVILQFQEDAKSLKEKLERFGHMPLPPYIRREDNSADRQQYQTVYAKHDGSVAAPTAGLHFTEPLLHAIDSAGVERAHVTLHVGGGTFLPVKVEDTDEHVMHSEFATVSAAVAEKINRAKEQGGRVIAVGTTSLRTLESAAGADGKLRAFSGETNIFITPGYKFKMVDMLLTNFHLPRSTLFMLVSAFCGLDRMRAAYAHAIAKEYRFYSYGDACLLYWND